MLPSVELRYVPFEVSLSAFRMRRPVHMPHLRPELVLYPLRDERYEDIDVDVPVLQISDLGEIKYNLTQPAKNQEYLFQSSDY